MDCMRAAEAMYILEPERRYSRDRAQAREAAKEVLIFFRGMYIKASWNLTSSVPASLNPTRL